MPKEDDGEEGIQPKHLEGIQEKKGEPNWGSSDYEGGNKTMSNEPPETIKNRARKSRTVAILLAIFFPPVAYIYVGKWAWALVNLFTANYLIFGGFVIVPIHTYLSINNAREEVSQWEGSDLNPS